MSRLRADLLLLLAAFIWGTAFIAQKDANAHIGALTFVGLRNFLAAMLLAPMARRESKKRRGAFLKRSDILLAVSIGITLCIAASMQQIGLRSTTITNAGFLTAVYVAFVPFIHWALTGKAPRLPILLACVVSVTGAWLLAGGYQLDTIGEGDILVFTADIAWALHVTLVSRFMVSHDRPFTLSFIQYFVVGLFVLIGGVIFEPTALSTLAQALPAILYAGIFSSGVAYTLQVFAQRHTPPAEASLIMSLESVFAAISGMVIFQERLTNIALAGCLLIICGVALIELSPLWSKMRKKA